jgi:hypothetical protein
MGIEAFQGFRLRGRTADRASALARRGNGGCPLPIGNGRLAMMRPGDASLNEQQRAGLVAQRQPQAITVLAIPIAAEIEKSAASHQTISPKTLEVEGQTYKRITVEELTSQEGAQILKPEDINGHNARELKAQLNNPSEKPLTYVGEEDTLRIVRATNGAFRLMTNAEVDNLPEAVRSQLKGNNWFLVETERGSGRYNWRCHGGSRCVYNVPESRDCCNGVRLVGDL